MQHSVGPGKNSKISTKSAFGQVLESPRGPLINVPCDLKVIDNSGDYVLDQGMVMLIL